MDNSEYKQIYELENNYWWYKTLHNLVKTIIIKENYQNTDIRILDAGCGSGRMLEILCNYGLTEGIDYSEHAVSFAKKRGLINIIQGDLNDWNYPKSIFDVIVCLDVLYHSKIIDDIELLQNINSSLKTNGITIINVPAFKILQRQHDIVVAGKRRYRRNRLTSELKKMGFDVLFATYRHPYLFFIILIKKVFSHWFSTGNPNSDLKPIPKWINNIFIFIGNIENKIILFSSGIPFGSSLFIVARKKKD